MTAGCTPGTPRPAGPWFSRQIILQSANLSLTVEDPIKVLAQIEGAVVEMGGVVISSSSWSSPGAPSSASLSARISPEALPKLRRIALGMASQVQNDNLYSQDTTQDYLRLRRRLEDLIQAEADLLGTLTGADRQAAKSLMIASQMVAQERANIESQIADYDGRAGLASFDLSLNGPSPMLMIE